MRLLYPYFSIKSKLTIFHGALFLSAYTEKRDSEIFLENISRVGLCFKKMEKISKCTELADFNHCVAVLSNDDQYFNAANN